MNTVAFRSQPDPLTVVCGYDAEKAQVIIYGVYGAEIDPDTLRRQYADMPNVQFVRQFKNMHQPHVVFSAKKKVKQAA